MLSLFSGIGGIDLAGEWAGMKTVAFCEIDPFCQDVLRRHWPGAPIFDDIRALTAESLHAQGVDHVDIVAGGFPCQPYSDSGHRRGDEDDRALWPEMLRIIKELQPAWIVGENVTGLIKLGALDGIATALEAEGYETRTIVFPACALDARHIRNRVFILAHAQCRDGIKELWRRFSETRTDGHTAQASRLRAHRPSPTQRFHETVPFARRDEAGSVRGGAHGIPARVGDRPRQLKALHALGNAVMPEQIFPLLKLIVDIEQLKTEVGA